VRDDDIVDRLDEVIALLARIAAVINPTPEEREEEAYQKAKANIEEANRHKPTRWTW
jgi:hypothetical protein